jgi:phytanoyl-CoA hydroxylase
VQQKISDEQWRFFEDQGYLRLGRLVPDHEVAALQQRINDIMLGKARIDYDRTLMQLDSDNGSYENIGAMTNGFKGAQLNYRKIEQLEFDPLFLRYLQNSVFRDACARVYGADTPVRVMRAMFMNKPAGKGTWLPWHQDAWTFFDRQPLLTVWMALDAATKANGCVQIIPGSHKRGHINPSHGSGFLTKELAEQHCPPQDVVHVEMEAGDVALFHNFLLHASDVNHSNGPRRAFSVCYMDAATRDERGRQYTLVFADEAVTPE